MSIVLMLALSVGIAVGTGFFLLMSASLWRKILGMLALGNGINLMIVIIGFRPYDLPEGLFAPIEFLSRPAFVASDEHVLALGRSDPLPQALVLTAIVIGFAVVALLMGFYLTEGKHAQKKSQILSGEGDAQ